MFFLGGGETHTSFHLKNTIDSLSSNINDNVIEQGLKSIISKLNLHNVSFWQQSSQSGFSLKKKKVTLCPYSVDVHHT